jgi:hypothetical protein
MRDLLSQFWRYGRSSVAMAARPVGDSAPAPTPPLTRRLRLAARRFAEARPRSPQVVAAALLLDATQVLGRAWGRAAQPRRRRRAP